MDAVPVPAGDVVAAELEDEVALLLPDSGDTVLLNTSATAIWAACDGRRTVGAIAADLQREFPDATGLVEQVAALVADLVRRHFLVYHDAPLDDRATVADERPA